MQESSGQPVEDTAVAVAKADATAETSLAVEPTTSEPEVATPTATAKRPVATSTKGGSLR